MRSSYLCEGDAVRLTLTVYVVWLHQVQAVEVQSELTDVGVSGFDPVRAGPRSAVPPGVTDVPEDQVSRMMRMAGLLH